MNQTFETILRSQSSVNLLKELFIQKSSHSFIIEFLNYVDRSQMVEDKKILEILDFLTTTKFEAPVIQAILSFILSVNISHDCMYRIIPNLLCKLDNGKFYSYLCIE